ncbi:alpha/beta hydrolase [Gordonia zhaorongruii]|uniref:alpha/beta hydrolase n=1 Tax=Gordonia zhaorongruii TaxID=2597659 RepID=UPI00117DB15F|nr:alpha/beta hydrolase [Gordonia zhaorongruii]
MTPATAGHGALRTHIFGPEDARSHVLALHGLTGHGGRWSGLAAEYLPDVRVVAPDLLGHGASPWEPPWGIADHVAAVSDVIDSHIRPEDLPVVVLAHSYGAAVALALAEARPAAVTGLVLLDPAQGLDPEFARAVSEASLAHWTYPDAAAAESAKRAEGWGQVSQDVLDEEIAEHLMPTTDGRVAWRVSAPATATAWSEMTRPFALPPAGVPTHVVVADRVDPPFVRPAFLEACARERADTVRVHHVDTEHMVPYLAPETSANLVLDLTRSIADEDTGART